MRHAAPAIFEDICNRVLSSAEGECLKLLESYSATGFMTASRLLSDDVFAHIVRNAPLVAIDIVIKDPEKMRFLALECTSRRRGRYFVPDGVIRASDKPFPEPRLRNSLRGSGL